GRYDLFGRGFGGFAVTIIVLPAGRRAGARCGGVGRLRRHPSKSAHGSARSFANRSGTVCSVNARGSSLTFTSCQASGVATPAPGRARGEKEATAVEPRPLRNQSIRMRP